MKKQIRNGVFETNSSSVHSITLCTDTEYDKWKKGELVYDYWNDKLIPAIELTDEEKCACRDIYERQATPYHMNWDELTDLVKESWYRSCGSQVRGNDENVKSFDEYWRMAEDYETFESSYTLPSGEKVIAFGYYGADY